MDDLSHKTIKGYELRECIGKGGFGAVYHAHQPLLKREVAVKVILPQYANQPDFIRRFEFEAELVARLEHPHIVPLYDFWREPEGAFLVMRFLRGGNLTSHLLNQPIDLQATAQVLDQITAALSVAHRNSVIHRDIKPDNILFDEDHNAYLVDFGIAKSPGVESFEDDDAVTGSIRYAAPEQIQSGEITPQTDIYGLGIMLYEMLTGEHPFSESTLSELLFKHLQDPLPTVSITDMDISDAVDRVIQKATAKNPADRYSDVRGMAQAFREAITEDTSSSWYAVEPLDEVVELVNPYKGLRPFQEADADEFFGRSALVEQLLKRLAEPDQTARFLAVIGPSGSGKSSVVKAGLIPALRQGDLPGSENWFITDITPGAHPFDELEIALLRIAANPAVDLKSQLERDERGLLRAAQLALPDDGQLVLLVDQFEEVFTLVKDEAQRAHFLNSLLAVANEPQNHLRVVITLRADFYDRPLLYPGFGELVRKRMETVLPLSPEELTEVIVNPAFQAGALVETGLVDAIIQDIGDQAAALPLVQYALTELFERHERGTLTAAAYHSIGGVMGALARRAEDLFTGLDETQQETTRQLLLRLVTLGEGAEDTRRRISRSELGFLDDEHIDAVVDVFGAARLLTFDRDPVTRGPTIEIAHEALIRQWNRLREWLETNREDLRLHRRLTAETHEWVAADRDPSFLATGGRLEQYELWVKTTDLLLNQDESAYVAAGVRQREERRIQEEARKEHELQLQKRANRRLQYLAAALVVFLIGAAGLSAVAFNERNQAEEARVTSDAHAATAVFALGLSEHREAESRSLALASRARLELNNHNTDLAIPLALAANQIENPPPLAQQTLRDVVYAPGTRHHCVIGDTPIINAALNPADSQILVSAWDGESQTSTLVLWDVINCQIIHQQELSVVVSAMAFTPDGETALTISWDAARSRLGDVTLWDLDKWEPIYEKSAPGYSAHMAMDREGKQALFDYFQGGTVVWDVAAGEIIQQVDAPYIISDFTPDGQQILSCDQETIVLWDIESGEPVRRYEKPEISLVSVAASSDQRYVIGGSSNAWLVLWDFESGEILRQFYGHSEEALSVAFTSDNQRVLSASNDNSLRLWDVASGTEILRFDGHGDMVPEADFLPSGNQAISWSADNTVRVWDLTPANQILRFEGHQSGVNAVALSPDGRIASTGDINGGLVLWDTATGEILNHVKGHDFVNRIAFSPDGRYMVSGSKNGLILWDNEDNVARWAVNGLHVTGVAFSPDGKTGLAGTSEQYTVNQVWLWDTETGEVLRQFEYPDYVFSVAFMPDGGRFLFSTLDHACMMDLETGEEIRCFRGHEANVWTVKSSPDGQTIVTASYDNSVRLWDSETGEEIRRFEGLSAPVTEVSFSKDGRTILSSSVDGSVRLWNVETGEEIQRMIYPAAVWSSALNASGDQVLIGSQDGTASVWDFSPKSVSELIEWAEQNRYIPAIPCDLQISFGIASECSQERE